MDEDIRIRKLENEVFRPGVLGSLILVSKNFPKMSEVLIVGHGMARPSVRLEPTRLYV